MNSDKTLNLIKYYATDSVKSVLMTTEDKLTEMSIFKSISLGMQTVDNLLNRPIYHHIKNLQIDRTILINPKDLNCDLLIIHSSDLKFIATKLNQAVNKKVDVIFINKAGGLENITPGKDWDLTEEDECFILEYRPEEYENNSREDVYHFYELMAEVHDVLDAANVEYFLIKGSCLGAVRNRSHIVYSDYIHIGCFSKDKETIRGSVDNNQYLNYKDDKIELTNSVYVKISFDPDVTTEELGSRKIYNYGPVKAYSLERPIPYLKRVFGDRVFEELISGQLSEPIRSPKRLYDCYYNTWSPYTSRFFKNQLAKHLKQTTDRLSKQGTKWWIDCGTLLGAVRNGRIPLFDDDADIGVFRGQTIQANNTYINFITHFNPMIFYAGNLHKDVEQIEETNYMFARKNLTATEFREYIKQDGKYIAAKDNIVSNAHGVPDLINKRAVDEKYFDDELDEIALEGYVFKCPKNPYEYVVQEARYGKDSANGNPIRNGKPGGDVLRDDWI